MNADPIPSPRRSKCPAFRGGCTESAHDLPALGKRRHKGNASYLPVFGQREPVEKPLGCPRSDSRALQVLGKTRRRDWTFSHHTKRRHRRFPAGRRGARRVSASAAICKMRHQFLMADHLRGIAIHFRLALVQKGFKLSLAACRNRSYGRFPKPCGQLAAILRTQLHCCSSDSVKSRIHKRFVTLALARVQGGNFS